MPYFSVRDALTNRGTRRDPRCRYLMDAETYATGSQLAWSGEFGP